MLLFGGHELRGKLQIGGVVGVALDGIGRRFRGGIAALFKGFKLAFQRDYIRMIGAVGFFCGAKVGADIGDFGFQRGGIIGGVQLRFQRLNLVSGFDNVGVIGAVLRGEGGVLGFEEVGKRLLDVLIVSFRFKQRECLVRPCRN